MMRSIVVYLGIMRSTTRSLGCFAFAWLLFFAAGVLAEAPEWTFDSPRPEAAPQHRIDPDTGHNGQLGLVMENGPGRHWMGHWAVVLPVKGGSHYAFTAWRLIETKSGEPARRGVYARVLWQDEEGRPVTWEEPAKAGYAIGTVPRAEPEYPAEAASMDGKWGRFEGVLRAPVKARQARVELHLQWMPDTRVTWSDVSLAEVPALAPRKVRLAAVHLQPHEGRLPQDKPPQFAALIAQAAKEKADLVVLPETLTYYGTGLKMHECAETIPGPSTDYFGGLAKQHGLHIVAGLVEQDGPAIYNVAVLIGPQGQLIGKYRKVCLPRGEIEAGLTPGTDYPVFETEIGKIGMMVCYDGFFPEVARALSVNGAEIIAWPVWGCNPLLAQARACENRIFVVSSTFMKPDDGWMLSAIYDQGGKPIAQAEKWSTIALAEVDLNQPYHGPYNLGDFHSMIERHRPLVGSER